MRLSPHCVLCAVCKREREREKDKERERERDENYSNKSCPFYVWGDYAAVMWKGKTHFVCVCVCVCGLCVQLAVVNLFSIKLYFIRFSMASISAYSHKADVSVILIALTPN